MRLTTFFLRDTLSLDDGLLANFPFSGSALLPSRFLEQQPSNAFSFVLRQIAATPPQ